MKSRRRNTCISRSGIRKIERRVARKEAMGNAWYALRWRAAK